MSEDETFDALTQLLRTVSSPNPRMPLPAAGATRLIEAGLGRWNDWLSTKGIGPIENGTIMLCSPDIADRALSDLNIIPAQDVAVSAFYTFLGQLEITTAKGLNISFDPLLRFAFVIRTIETDSLMIQLDVASTLYDAVENTKDGDQLIDLQGRNLHQQLHKHLGPLSYGMCYATDLPPHDPQRYRAEAFKVVDINDYILELHKSGQLEIIPIDPKDIAPPGEAWGDDWDEV